jgi:peptide/nickel transport system substrate-binding protein
VAFGNWIAIYPQMIDPTPVVIADVRFRRALLHGIDREQMAENLQAGMVPVAHSFVNPSLPESRAVEDAAVRYAYDPGRAARMIEELGYVKGADGFFSEPGGQRLLVELRAFPRAINEKSLLAVADYWQRLGVGVEAFVVPPQRTRDYQYLYTRPGFELTGNPNSFQDLNRFHSREAPMPENGFAGGNRARYRSSELDALIDRFFVTVPLVERVEVLRGIVRHMTEHLNVMGLFHDMTPVMVSNRLDNVTYGGLPSSGSDGHLWSIK